LLNVNITGLCPLQVPEVAKVDPKFRHFIWNTVFRSPFERSLGDRSQPISSCYANAPLDFRKGFASKINVAFVATTEMDKNGFFNFGPSCSYARTICDSADIVIVETNNKAPICLGGVDEGIHISEVDYVVEGTNEPLILFPQDIPSSDIETNCRLYY
jgi:acyl-CoA hydrolase